MSFSPSSCTCTSDQMCSRLLSPRSHRNGLKLLYVTKSFFLLLIFILTQKVWHRSTKFPYRRLFILPHGRETPLRPPLPGNSAYQATHIARLVYLDDSDIDHEWRGIHPCSWSANILVSGLHRCLSLRKLVHLRNCRCFLALRCVSWPG